MKKFVAGLVTAGVLSAGFIGVEGAVVSSHAAVARDGYPDNKAEVQDLVQKINKLIDNDKLSPAKAVKIISKLKDAKDAGVIGKTKFKQLKKLIKNGL